MQRIRLVALITLSIVAHGCGSEIREPTLTIHVQPDKYVCIDVSGQVISTAETLEDLIDLLKTPQVAKSIKNHRVIIRTPGSRTPDGNIEPNTKSLELSARMQEFEVDSIKYEYTP